MPHRPLGTLLLPLAFCSMALAQGPLQFMTLERQAGVDTAVQFDDDPDDCSENDDKNEQDSTLAAGTWSFGQAVVSVGGGATSRADARVESAVFGDRIEVRADLTADTELGDACSASSEAAFALTSAFTVDAVTEASLTGMIRAVPQGGLFGPTLASAVAQVSGFSPTGGVVNESFQVGTFASDSELDVFAPITFYPDGEYAIFITGTTGVTFDGPGEPAAEPGDVEITIVLSLGDADQDGLLDDWEINGIDINEDGTPELDLPAMGADPLRKDIFVEIDVMLGTNLDEDALRDVRTAFANAPRALVDNPDGSRGITLHTMVSDRSLPPTVYPAPPAFWGVVAGLKDQFIGTAAERSSPDADLIKEARLRAVRYCVWGGRRPSDRALGVGEIPGDDLTVMLDSRVNGGTRDVQAGVFMHELGHTLGLRHGGGDDINRKPNYVSVMNYALTIPYDKFPSDVNARWRLDYSQRTLDDLDENDIKEPEGFGLQGPPDVAGRFGFVSVPDPSPPADMPNNRITLPVPLDQTPVDLNFDGDTNDTGLVDVNRDGAATVLRSFNDWANLQLPLAGSTNFGSGNFGRGEDSDELPGGTLSITLLDEIADELPNAQPSPCSPADLVDTFGILDLADVDAFIIAFASGDPGATPSADLVDTFGILDLADIDAFITAFTAGCP